MWQYLSEHPAATTVEIAKALKVDEPLLNMAIGWLAREDKLVFGKKGKSMTLSLKPE